MNWIKKLLGQAVRERSDLFTLAALEQEQGAPARRPLRAEEEYVSVIVRSLYVPFRRLNLTAFHGTVMSELSLANSGTGETSFHVVSSPSLLSSRDAANLANAIPIDVVLLDRVPYRGGRIAAEVGLFAEKSADLARPLVDVVSAVAGAAGVAYVSAAQPFLLPLRHAMDVLAGVPNALTLLVGLYGNLPAETGYLAVIAAAQKDVEASKLKLAPSSRTLCNPDGTDFTAAAYMILSVEAAPAKEDWSRIPELLAAHKRVREALIGAFGANRQTAAVQAMDHFRVTALTSPDLLFADAQEIVRKAQDRLDAILGSGVSKVSAETAEWPEELSQL